MDTKPISTFLNEVNFPHYEDVLSEKATLTMEEYKRKVVDMREAAEAELLQTKVNEPDINLTILKDRLREAFNRTSTRRDFRGTMEQSEIIEGKNAIDKILYYECGYLQFQFRRMFSNMSDIDTTPLNKKEDVQASIKESKEKAEVPQREWYNAKEICEVFPALSYNNVKDAQWRAKTGFDKCAQQLGKKSKITFNRQKVEDWILDNMDPDKVASREKRAESKSQKR